jgi:alkylhydroperoxidase family enzyme
MLIRCAAAGAALAWVRRQMRLDRDELIADLKASGFTDEEIAEGLPKFLQ